MEGAHAVVVLSHSFWQRRFGGDQGIIGRSLLLNRVPFTVVGVAPEGFEGMDTGIRQDCGSRSG